MKLLTHNFLASKFLKEAKNGYPLKLTCEKKEVHDVNLDVDFLKNIMTKVNYNVLWDAAESLGESEGLPAKSTEVISLEGLTEGEIAQLHKVVMCVDVIEGSLECPDTGRKFPIREGIPNMLVDENEVA